MTQPATSWRPAAAVVAFPRPARAARVRPGLEPAAGWPRNMMERVRCWIELRDLALFQPDCVLADVGMTRAQALRLSRAQLWLALSAPFARRGGGC